jgi:predicted MFS family arabinose efflux permease
MHAPAPWLRAAAAMTAIGWGANQFASLLGVYRHALGGPEVAGLFGAYALGLMPALLIASPISDRVGRRPVLRVALVLAVVASIVLLLAGDSFPLLLAGRLVIGVAAGTAFGPGTAWVKELSTRAGAPASGARRAAIALTLGFACGPFVAGLLAQWAPLPEVLPYVIHLVVAALAIVAAWTAPETVSPRAAAASRPPSELRRAVLGRLFLLQALPTAPWVFGAASASLAVLPAFLALGGYGEVVSAVVAAVTLGTGIAVQTPARALLRRGRRLTLAVGVGAAVAGLLLGALTVATQLLPLLAPSAILLGAAYGILLIGGLNAVEAVAAADDLATVTGIFYCLTYVGFGYPLLVAALAGVLPVQLVLVLSAAVAAIGWITLAVARARRGTVSP